MSRKIFYIFGFAIALLGVAPLFVDFSDYAAPYLKDAEKTIGRSIKTGSVRIQIFPTPRIKINDVSVGNMPDGTQPEMAKLKSAEIILSFIDLLSAKVVIKSIELKCPEILLEKTKSGIANWSFVVQEKKDNKQQKTAETFNAASAGALGLVVHHFSISDAKIDYLDHQSGDKKSFSNLQIDSFSEALFGPYKIHLRSESGKDSIDAQVVTGSINLDGKTPIDVDVSLKYLQQKIQIKVDGDLDLGKEHFSGKINASSVDMPVFLELANQKIDLRKPIDVQATIDATKENIKVDNLSFKHPIGQISGFLNYSLSEQLLSADVSFSHMNDYISFKFFTKDFSEFDYLISTDNYQEILKWFSSKPLLKGHIDVKGLLKINDDKVSLKNTILRLGDASAEVNVKLNILTNEVSGDLKTKNIHQWGQVFGQNLPLLGYTSAEFRFLPNEKGLLIFAKLLLNHGSLTFEGATANNLTQGNLSLQKFNIEDYMINLSSQISLKDSQVNLDITNIDVREKTGFDLSAAGNLVIDLTKEKPSLTGEITAKTIQLTSDQDTTVVLANTLYRSDFFDFKFMNVALKANTRWSTAPIKLPLDKFALKLTVGVPKIMLSGFVFESLKSEITLDSGKLSIPFSALLYGGKLNGALLVQATKNQNISFSADFDGVRVERIDAAAKHFRKGNASGHIELKSIGDSQYDWIKNLQGQTKFTLIDGIVKGFDLHAIIGALKKPKNLLDFKVFENHFNGKGETAFSNAGAKFTIVNGVATTDDMTIKTADAELKVQGQADILDWQMDFKGEILTSLKDLPSINFTIKGPLDQPNYHLDLKQIQKLFMQNGAGDLISKTLGKGIPGIDKIIPGLKKKQQNSGASEPAASNSNEQQNQPNDSNSKKAENVVKGLLKGILG